MQDDRKVDALLRLHCGIEPDELDDEARLRAWFDYVFVRESTRGFLLGVMRQVVREMFPKQS